MEECDHSLALQKADISQKIKDGMESLRAGRHEDGKTYFDRLRARLEDIDRGDADIASPPLRSGGGGTGASA